MNKIWTKISSLSLVSIIRQRPHFYKIAKNTGWLFIDRLISLVIGLLVGAWVARYLGPGRYGTLNYALAYVALFTPIASLGLRDIVIRNIVKQPDDKDEILGTAFILQFITGTLILFFLIGIGYIASPDVTLERYLIIILTGSLIFRAGSNTLDYWFQSQVQSKFSVWAKNLSMLLIALIKISLIISQSSLVAFAWVILLEIAIKGFGMAVWYEMNMGHLLNWQASFLQAKKLLKDSWPLIISGFSVIIYMRVDQIMMGNMTSTEELGIYAVAVRLSELWYFIPIAIASSFFPTIIRSSEVKSKQVHDERMQLFFDIMTGGAYVLIIPTSLLAPVMVSLLFGDEFAGSGPILRVHIWSFLFVSLEVARSRWLMAENMTKFSMVATTLGAIVNIGLNLWLIPLYNGLGAAWATMISYAISGYFSTLLLFRLWSLFTQLSFSIFVPFRIISVWRSLKRFL